MGARVVQCNRAIVFPKWKRTFVEFTELPEFCKSDKSLKQT